MEIVQLFRQQSVWTYGVMKKGVEHQLIPEEETLTDMNLLAIAADVDPPAAVKTRRFSKHSESLNGADWEWHLINKNRKTVSFLVQAKRLFPETKSYESLAGTLDQCNKLIDYAAKNGLNPMYVFYNYLPGLEPVDTGCAVLGAYDVKAFIKDGDVSYDIMGPEQDPWFQLVDGTFNSADSLTLFGGKVTPVIRDEIPSHVADILAGRPVSYLDSGAKSILIIRES